MNEPQAAEQPVNQQDSNVSGIYTMDDAIASLINTPRDGDPDYGAQTEAEVEEPTVEEASEVEDKDDTDEQPESDVDDDLDSEEQPESEDEEEPDTSEVTLPSDDLVIAADGDVEITLGEMRENYTKAIQARDEFQADYTKKTQKLSEQSKLVEQRETQALGHYQALVNNLGQGLQQIDQTTDWNTLKQTDMAQYQQRLQQRNQLEGQLQQYTAQAEGLIKESQVAKKEIHDIQAKAAVDYLKVELTGWNEDLYEKIAKYAGSIGVTGFRDIIDGPTIKTFHDQMRAIEKKASLTKKIVKPVKQATQKAVKRDQRTALEKKLLKLDKRIEKGDQDAVIEKLMMTPRD